MAGRGTVVAERPSTQVDERSPRLSRQVVLALMLAVAALAIGLAVVLMSGDDVATQDAPVADTDAVPAYTGDWKDSVIGGEAKDITVERLNEQPAYTGDWKDTVIDEGR